MKPELFGDPPFKDPLHFVRMTFFMEANNSRISVNNADVQTAIRYATLAVQRPGPDWAWPFRPERLRVAGRLHRPADPFRRHDRRRTAGPATTWRVP